MPSLNPRQPCRKYTPLGGGRKQPQFEFSPPSDRVLSLSSVLHLSFIFEPLQKMSKSERKFFLFKHKTEPKIISITLDWNSNSGLCQKDVKTQHWGYFSSLVWWCSFGFFPALVCGTPASFHLFSRWVVSNVHPAWLQKVTKADCSCDQRPLLAPECVFDCQLATLVSLLLNALRSLSLS